VNVNIFCDFQILLVFGTGDMGLRRRNITKIPLKIDFCPLHPKKTCCLNFLRFGHGRLFYAKRIFVTCLVLSAQVFEQNNCFFGYVQIGFFQAWRQKWRQKYAITTSKDAPLEKKTCLTSRRSFCGLRVIAKVAPKCRYIGFCGQKGCKALDFAQS